MIQKDIHREFILSAVNEMFYTVVKKKKFEV